MRLRFCAKFFYSGEVRGIIRRFLDLYIRTHLFKFSFDIDFCCLCYIEIHWSFNFGMYIKHALTCLLQSNFLRDGEMLFEILKKAEALEEAFVFQTTFRRRGCYSATTTRPRQQNRADRRTKWVNL